MNDRRCRHVRGGGLPHPVGQQLANSTKLESVIRRVHWHRQALETQDEADTSGSADASPAFELPGLDLLSWRLCNQHDRRRDAVTGLPRGLDVGAFQRRQHSVPGAKVIVEEIAKLCSVPMDMASLEIKRGACAGDQLEVTRLLAGGQA
jgi:hypothetical protein